MSGRRGSIGVGLFLLAQVLGACSTYHKAKLSGYKNYPLTQASAVDSVTLAFYQPYKVRIDSAMNVIIGTAAAEIRSQRPEGPLNNLCADAVAEAARKRNISFDVVHLNYKGLRVPIPAGPIRTSLVYELMPFENLIVTVSMRGSQVAKLFDYMALQGGDPLAGASYVIDKGKAKNILIKGKPLKAASVYTILTNDYLANGGDEASVYAEASGRTEYPVKVREAILDYIKSETAAGRNLDPKTEGRITIEK